jgi:Protein of unknown function (DUF5661)
MSSKQKISLKEARLVGTQLGLDWAKIDLAQFWLGLEIELEHGTYDPKTDMTYGDLVLAGKIASVHLKKTRNYYTRLDVLQSETKDHSSLSDWLPVSRVSVVPETVPL